MAGSDLSQAYLDEASRFLHGRRNVTFHRANCRGASFRKREFRTFATCVYLYHELPNEVRRRVTSEIARVLKPGGLFAFVDLLQWDDVEGYDGLLEAFPQRYHEPYYLDYLGDTLDGPDGLFAKSGLQPSSSFPALALKIRDLPEGCIRRGCATCGYCPEFICGRAPR